MVKRMLSIRKASLGWIMLEVEEGRRTVEVVGASRTLGGGKGRGGRGERADEGDAGGGEQQSIVSARTTEQRVE